MGTLIQMKESKSNSNTNLNKYSQIAITDRSLFSTEISTNRSNKSYNYSSYSYNQSQNSYRSTTMIDSQRSRNSYQTRNKFKYKKIKTYRSKEEEKNDQIEQLKDAKIEYLKMRQYINDEKNEQLIKKMTDELIKNFKSMDAYVSTLDIDLKMIM